VIVLDTNVFSELMRPSRADSVASWARDQPRRTVYITALTVAETLRGIDRVPTGRRRTALEDGADDLFAAFHGQVLPFDYDAAFAFADVVDARVRNGRPISEVDAQIASICRARSVPLATRNIKDFELTGVDLIDPWAA
jgi:toxin FitB